MVDRVPSEDFDVSFKLATVINDDSVVKLQMD
jgi:hypothetical protein